MNWLERMNDWCENFWSKTYRFEPLFFTICVLVFFSLLMVTFLGACGVFS
jgi:hypothetical protein